MNEKEKQQMENLEEQTNILFKISNKLEQRIATLEKVLQSHAKCIGEMREKKDEWFKILSRSWMSSTPNTR